MLTQVSIAHPDGEIQPFAGNCEEKRLRSGERGKDNAKLPFFPGKNGNGGGDKHMKESLTAVFEKSPHGYIGYIEELPGANTQGETLEETKGEPD